MVSVFQETWNEGEAKGIIEMGHDFGLSEEDILARLQKKFTRYGPWSGERKRPARLWQGRTTGRYSN